MSPLEIKIALLRRKKRTNMSKIARSLDPPVSVTTVFQVIHRKGVSARIMQAVAAAIDKDVKFVFPERFSKSKSL